MTIFTVLQQALKPGTKPAKFFDGQGLYLEVSPTDGKLFRYKYRFNQNEKTLSRGQQFPEARPTVRYREDAS